MNILHAIHAEVKVGHFATHRSTVVCTTRNFTIMTCLRHACPADDNGYDSLCFSGDAVSHRTMYWSNVIGRVQSFSGLPLALLLLKRKCFLECVVKKRYNYAYVSCGPLPTFIQCELQPRNNC